jgi:hypothetical protein
MYYWVISDPLRKERNKKSKYGSGQGFLFPYADAALAAGSLLRWSNGQRWRNVVRPFLSC